MNCASGCEQQKIFENKHSAVSGQHSAKTAAFATLCRLGLGLGLGLGDPRVTLGSPKRHAWVTPGPPKGRMTKVFCLQQELKMPGWGVRKSRVIGKPEDLYRGLTRMTRIPYRPAPGLNVVSRGWIV